MGKHEELREIISDMRAHGFTQLRRTTHGWLYGFQTFRILIPHDLQDSHRASSVSMTQQEWTKLKGQVRGENPGLAAIVDTRYGDLRGPAETVSVDEIAPVVNIEDIVAAADADAAIVATRLAPDPPHHMEAPTVNPFADHAVWVGVAPTEDQTTMASLSCEKCDRKFTTAAALGRHRTAMHGLEHRDKRRQYEKPRPIPVVNNVTKQRAAAPVIVKPTDYTAIVESMLQATKSMAGAFQALLVERDHYKLERDELASRLKKFDAMKELFKVSFALKIVVREEDGKMPIIEATCRTCQEVTSITVTRDQLAELVRPGRRDRNIEEILPDKTADERELFISGQCGKCFDKLFGEEEPYEPIDAVCDVCGAIFKEDMLEATTRGDTTWWLCPYCVQE